MKVSAFHSAFDHPIHTAPQPLDTDVAKLRVALITEEYQELKEAKTDVDRVDALADLEYVTCGAALALGLWIDTDPITASFFDGISTEDHLEDLDASVAELVRAHETQDAMLFQDTLDEIWLTVQGLYVSYGFNGPAHFDLVHAANMAKLGPDGKPIYREDGKVLKPEGWTAPDHAPLLAAA
jgi:predicted HAD superfamily Cof-like phosphohydrolase